MIAEGFRLKATVSKRKVSKGAFGAKGEITLKLDGGGSVTGSLDITYLTNDKGLNKDWAALRKSDEVLVEVGL